MNKFNRKSMYVAVMAGLGAMGVAGTASAVHINPDGLGQALIYPYYTVRSASAGTAAGAYVTGVSVINTTSSAKAVKVRFIEGKNSREVLDFNLFMSANDVWTGAVVATADGAKLVSSDKSCTTGVIPSSGQAFSNGAYTGGQADGETATLDRTREGYIEVLEMGNIIDPNLLAAITHVAGVPNCGATYTGTQNKVLDVADMDNLGTSRVTTLPYLSAPTGGLGGAAAMLNVATGIEYSDSATALDNWANIPKGTNSTSTTPAISGGGIITSNVFNAGNNTTMTWGSSLNAVSAAIMRNTVLNEFVLEPATLSGTDWVVTFPTKRFYVSQDTNAANAATRGHTWAANPFNENFGVGGSCDDVTLRVFDREEQSSVSSGGFSPQQTLYPKLCWEANVITFNQPAVNGVVTSAILGSTNTNNVNTTYTNGWMQLGLEGDTVTPGHALDDTLTPLATSVNGVAVANQTVYGLPVVGFMVQDWVNGNLNGVLSNYGGHFAHKYTRKMQ